MVDWTCVGRGREKAWQSEEAMSTRGARAQQPSTVQMRGGVFLNPITVFSGTC